jgi:hypothetical protein
MVQYTDSLSPVQWVNLYIAQARPTNSIITVTDPSPKPKRYHRLVTPPQP